jgi:hypothetical protein
MKTMHRIPLVSFKEDVFDFYAVITFCGYIWEQIFKYVNNETP